jgi:F-type H+-transporting ATPase subunit a
MLKSVENNFSFNNNIQMDVISPLDQFEIRDILNVELLGGNLHLSLTNIGLYLIIGALIILTSSIIATNYNKLVSNN